MKKFREFLKDIITEDTYQPIEFPKEIVEKYKSLQNLKRDEQDAAINALSDEQRASLTEYGNEVAQHYRKYFKPWYEWEDDNKWYEKGMYEYESARRKFEELIVKLNKGVVKEDVGQQSKTFIPRAGNIIWGYLLQPNHNNFIYHGLRNLQGEHNFRKIQVAVKELTDGNASKLSSIAGTNKPVTLAIPAKLESGFTLIIYPSTIIDEVEGDQVAFHIDPKQYRIIKQKYGFNVKTTSLSLQYIKKHPEHTTLFDIEQTKSTTGFDLQNGGKYWYKVYGKEKGQLHLFQANTKCALLWEDLEKIFNTAIEWFDIQSEAKRKKEAERKAYASDLIDRGEKLYAKKEQFDKIYDPIYKKKGDALTTALNELSTQDLKNVESYAYYRSVNHYDIYEHEHKVAEYAEDWHYDAEKRHLENIRDKDYSIACTAKEILKKKAANNE